jgi:hypothetical protein
MEFKVWNLCEDWNDESGGKAYLVGTLEAEDLIEACKLAPAVYPEVHYMKVEGPVRGEIHSIEFPATERQSFEELRELLQISAN